MFTHWQGHGLEWSSLNQYYICPYYLIFINLNISFMRNHFLGIRFFYQYALASSNQISILPTNYTAEPGLCVCMCRKCKLSTKFSMAKNIQQSDSFWRLKCIWNSVKDVVLEVPALLEKIHYTCIPQTDQQKVHTQRVSYRRRLLFPVKVIPLQIVDGTAPLRLFASNDL